MRVPAQVALTIRVIGAVALCLILSGLATAVHAAFRGPGKYSGVVTFDRWDTCFLLSGHYITFISEAVKEDLRPYAGQAVQIDVTDILQPMNPGDGLVKAYTIVGRAPDEPSDSIADKIAIEVEPAFEGQRAPTFDITVRNISLETVLVSASEAGPTLLGTNEGVFSPSDGKSRAWITRSSLSTSAPDQSAPSSWSSTVGGKSVYTKYNVEEPCAFEGRIFLESYKTVSCRVRFEVPAGEYQFLAGYGGGVHQWKSVASNAISFKVDNSGIATVEP